MGCRFIMTLVLESYVITGKIHWLLMTDSQNYFTASVLSVRFLILSAASPFSESSWETLTSSSWSRLTVSWAPSSSCSLCSSCSLSWSTCSWPSSMIPTLKWNLTWPMPRMSLKLLITLRRWVKIQVILVKKDTGFVIRCSCYCVFLSCRLEAVVDAVVGEFKTSDGWGYFLSCLDRVREIILFKTLHSGEHYSQLFFWVSCSTLVFYWKYCVVEVWQRAALVLLACRECHIYHIYLWYTSHVILGYDVVYSLFGNE